MVWNSSIFLQLPSESISLKVTPDLHHMSILGTEGVTIGEYRRAFVQGAVSSVGLPNPSGWPGFLSATQGT